MAWDVIQVKVLMNIIMAPRRYVMELAVQRMFERLVATTPGLHPAAAAAYQAYVRAYSAHSKVIPPGFPPNS